MVRDAGKSVAKPSVGIDGAQHGSSDKGLEDGCDFSTRISEEKVVLPTDGDETIALLGRAIVQLQDAVVELGRKSSTRVKVIVVERGAMALPQPTRRSADEPLASFSSARSWAIRAIASSAIGEPWLQRMSTKLRRTCAMQSTSRMAPLRAESLQMAPATSQKHRKFQ